MDAAKKLAGKHNLQDLVPLNALSDARFAEVAHKIVIEELRKGRYLFRKGDRDNQSIYLLDGKVNLIDGHRKVTGEVEAGTDISRYPIANQQPRTLSARAVTRVVIARIDSGLCSAQPGDGRHDGDESCPDVQQPLHRRPGRLRPAGGRGLARRALRKTADADTGVHRDHAQDLRA